MGAEGDEGRVSQDKVGANCVKHVVFVAARTTWPNLHVLLCTTFTSPDARGRRTKMLPKSLQICSLLLLNAVLSVHAVHFYLDANEKRCFLEEIPSDTVVEGTPVPFHFIERSASLTNT